MSDSKVCLVTAWHDRKVRDAFCEAWKITGDEPHVVLQQDPGWKSCARTKNAGVDEAIKRGAEVVVIVDDDCLPTWDGYSTLNQFITAHLVALEPVEVEMFKAVTNPPSRGTPYYNRTVKMPVAASLGFWRNVPDLCAPGQLIYGPTCSMEFDRSPIFGRAFPFSGMNVAMRVEFLPWSRFIDLPRVDDIFGGYLFQREAYRRGYCFNLGGPDVWHARQSNVWQNLKDEANYLQENETLWSRILMSKDEGYQDLLDIIPKKV